MKWLLVILVSAVAWAAVSFVTATFITDFGIRSGLSFVIAIAAAVFMVKYLKLRL